MKLLSIGDRVGAGTYGLYSRFPRAVNFADGPRLVCLVAEEIGAGPLNVVLAGLDAHATGAALLHITEGMLQWGPLRLQFDARQVYRSELDPAGSGAAQLRHNLRTLGTVLAAEAPFESLAFLLDDRRMRQLGSPFERALAARINEGVAEVFAGDLQKGIESLRGCGRGLTPSGDDFIAGLLIGLNVLQQEDGVELRPAIDGMARWAQTDNVFSNAWLEVARRGRVSQGIKELLQALAGGGEDAVRTAVRKLIAAGATSGADLGTGLYMTLKHEEAIIARCRDFAAEVSA